MAITKNVLKQIRERAGLHSDHKPPSGDRERELWGMVEILDYECCKYGDFTSATEDEIKAYLKKYKNEVLKLKCDPPSFLGLFCGVLDFLKE